MGSMCSNSAACLATPFDEQLSSTLSPGPHTQKVFVEVHEDSRKRLVPVSPDSSHGRKRAKTVDGTCSRLQRLVSVRSNTSLDLILSTEDEDSPDDQYIVTEDGKLSICLQTVILYKKLYKMSVLKVSHFILIVHFRKRRSNQGILKNPSTSANTFWQIEKCIDRRSGKDRVM